MKWGKWVTLGFGAICLVAVAGVINSPHLYYMAAILLTLPAVSYGLGWLALKGLTFSREVPLTAWAGEYGRIVYSAENRSSVARFFLTAEEDFPTWIVPVEDQQALFNVDARETAQLVYPVHFLRRGVHRIESFRMSALDPLGVFEFSRHIPCQSELVVYPVPSPIHSVVLSGSDRYGTRNFTTLVFHGSSVEPDGVRQYVPGDSLRRIHWRQTARTGRLSVIEFEETQSINLVVGLDLSDGPVVGSESQTPLEYAVRLAASLAQMAVQVGASVRLVAQIPEGDEMAARVMHCAAETGRGQEHMTTILDALARAEETGDASLAGVLSEGVATVLPGTSLVVVARRPDLRLVPAIAGYRAAGATVIIVYVDCQTFDGGRGAVRAADEQRFFAEMSVVNAHLFKVKCNSSGELRLEEYMGGGTSPREATIVSNGW